ncbi:hypothetical protein EBZ37_15290 [bacterium]|nr:hypothetical protein [bacterium]
MRVCGLKVHAAIAAVYEQSLPGLLVRSLYDARDLVSIERLTAQYARDSLVEIRNFLGGVQTRSALSQELQVLRRTRSIRAVREFFEEVSHGDPRLLP